MQQPSGFHSLGIAPSILARLEALRFTAPTPIQEQSIPSAIEGKDLIGIAQTGTGKTLAFGIPMLQAALRGEPGLIVLPTRELALQVHEAISQIGSHLRVSAAVLIGGEPMGRQLAALRRKPLIIIGTPGRILDHLTQKTFSVATCKLLVLDEADRMLDMGFAPQLNRILSAVPRERQTLLFSATMPQDIVAIAQRHMRLPVRVEIAPPGTTAATVSHELFFVERHDKPRLLEKLLGEYRGSVLVFSRTKYGAKKVAAFIRTIGYSASEIHSNRSLSQRREALDGFKNGRYRVLAATDIAARGIDVRNIEVVINFDLPQSAEDYVHRIGRTGRAGEVGHAISFATPDQKRDVRDIERLVKLALPLSRLPELPPARAGVVTSRPDRPGFRSGQRGYAGAPARRGSGSRQFSGRPSGPSFRGRRPSHGFNRG